MPGVTVSGSGSNTLTFTSNDSLAYAQNAANQIASAISGGAAAVNYAGGTVAASPPSGSGVSVRRRRLLGLRCC